MDREQLYERIDARVDAMLAAGVAGRGPRARSRGRLGDGPQGARASRSCSAGDVEQMKRRTRNYARRQLTWMRKLAGVRVLDATGRSAQDVAGEIFAAWRSGDAPAPAAAAPAPSAAAPAPPAPHLERSDERIHEHHRDEHAERPTPR